MGAWSSSSDELHVAALASYAYSSSSDLLLLGLLPSFDQPSVSAAISWCERTVEESSPRRADGGGLWIRCHVVEINKRIGEYKIKK